MGKLSVESVQEAAQAPDAGNLLRSERAIPRRDSGAVRRLCRTGSAWHLPQPAHFDGATALDSPVMAQGQPQYPGRELIHVFAHPVDRSRLRASVKARYFQTETPPNARRD
jgi:hypothetical protein